VLGHALRDREHTYIGGQHGIARLTAAIGSGTMAGEGLLKLPEQNLPGRPQACSSRASSSVTRFLSIPYSSRGGPPSPAQIRAVSFRALFFGRD